MGFGVVQIWDVATGKVLVTHGENHPESRGPVRSLDWSPDGRYIATDDIEIWDPDTGNEVTAVKTAESVKRILWSPDGKYLMAAEDHETLEIGDSTNLVRIKQKGLNNHDSCVIVFQHDSATPLLQGSAQ